MNSISSFYCSKWGHYSFSSNLLSLPDQISEGVLRKSSESPIKPKKPDYITSFIDIPNELFAHVNSNESTTPDLKSILANENARKFNIPGAKSNYVHHNVSDLMYKFPENNHFNISRTKSNTFKYPRKTSSNLKNEMYKYELFKAASPENRLTIPNDSNISISQMCKELSSLLKNNHENITLNYSNYVYEAVQALNYISELNPNLSEEYKKHSIILEPTHKQLTIIFDLDETLIHFPKSSSEPEGEVLLNFLLDNGEQCFAGINIRPYIDNCFKDIIDFCEIIIFTASLPSYAKVIIDYLDPKRDYIAHVLSRENCIYDKEKGLYIKDLRILNRDLSKTIIIDNNILSFAFQLDNGVPTIPFYNDKSDRFLKRISDYIFRLRDYNDVRDLNRKEFMLQKTYDQGISKYFMHYIKSNNSKSEIMKNNEEEVNSDKAIKVSSTKSSFDINEECFIERKAHKLLLPGTLPNISEECKEFLDSILFKYNSSKNT